jgi:DHA2 family multidrug resistance protein
MSGWKKPKFFTQENPLFPWLILFNVAITTFMSLASAAVTIVGSSSIQGELALSNPQATWVTTFYLLGVNSMIPAASWFGERYGYKKIYALGVLIFTLGSGGAGFAFNFLSIGLARLIEGMGAGLVFPIGLAMIGRNLPKESLGLGFIIYIAVGFGAGLGLGLPISGYFCEFHSWRDVFYIILPIGLLATLDCWLFHDDTAQIDNGRFDIWGFLAFITFISSLLVALSFGALPSTDEGWTSPFILGTFALALAALIGTIWIESTIAKPIIPLKLFQNPVFSVSSLALFLLGMALFSSISSAADFMLNALNYDKYTTGLISMTYGLSMAAASILSGGLIKKVPISVLTLAGLGLLVFSYFLNNEITLQSYPGQVIVILLLRGAGVGLSLGPITGFAMKTVPKEMAGEAATLLTFFRQVGGTYGGTIIAILVIKRKIFHVARFSETVSAQNPGYRYTWQRLYNKFSNVLSDNNLIAGKQAKAEIIKTIETQAYVQSINDAMVVFGWITLAVALFILYLNLKQFWSANRKSSKVES